MIARLLLLCLLLIPASGCLNGETPGVMVKFENGATINADIAKNQDERARGLMFRESLEENSGMLFVFEEEGYHAFWMKNVRFPLDILWLDRDLKVVHISANTPPCIAEPCSIYASPKPAKYVLEVKANFTRENNVKIGDQLFLDVSQIER
jgi:uncharacterized membrane protein (UPF0127 family)